MQILLIAFVILMGPFGTEIAFANCNGTSPLTEEKAKAQKPQCDANYSADHDLNRGSNMFSASHVCEDIYKTIVQKIDAYESKRTSSCSEINGLVTKAKSCNTDECQGEANKAYLAAAQKEKDLADFLATTKTEIEKLAGEAEAVLEKYRDDNRKMIEALNRAEKKKADLINRLQSSTEPSDLGKELATVNDLLNNAKGVSGNELVKAPVVGESGVSSRDGGGVNIRDYQEKKIPQLVDEQATAKIRAEEAARKAAQQEKYHRDQAALYEKLAATAQTRKDNTRTAGEKTDPNKSGKTAGNGSDSQISDQAQDQKQEPASSAGGGAPAGGAPAGGGSPASPSDPFQSTVGNSEGAVASKSPSIQSQKNKGSANPFDITNARSKTSDMANYREELRQRAGSYRSSASSKDRAPASQTSAPTEIRDGVSGSGGSGAMASVGGSDQNNTSKSDAPRFGENLNAGMMDIAGSDIATSLSSMAEELGIQSSDGLTEAEEASLALSENQELTDPAVLKEESQALFVRTKLALQRAQTRGDLSGLNDGEKKLPFF